jgi:hypothetical protein
MSGVLLLRVRSSLPGLLGFRLRYVYALFCLASTPQLKHLFQDLNNQGIRLHTDTAVQVADVDAHQRSQKMVDLDGGGRDEEYDLDGSDSVQSIKRNRAL